MFVIESFWPEVGGLQRSTQRLAERFVLLGHDVRIVTQLPPGVAPSESRAGLSIYRYEEGRVPFTGRAAEAGLFVGADVICVFGVGSDPSARWWLPVLDPLPPGVVRFLKPGTEGDITLIGVPAPLYRRFDGVLCQTSYIAEEAKAVGVPAGHCFPVRNGLPLRDWRDDMPTRSQARAMLRVEPSSFVVLGLGRFIRRKRFPDLVRAFAVFAAAASTRGPGAPPVLLLHGSDFGHLEGEEIELRRMAEPFAPSMDVRFMSPEIDPRVTLAAADVLAVLSEREGAPNVFVEAFASGCPVVATHLIGHRVYIRHGREGLLVPVGDPEAVAAGFHALSEQPDWRRAMSSAARTAAARFDIGRAAEDYQRAFASARETRPNPRRRWMTGRGGYGPSQSYVVAVRDRIEPGGLWQ